MMKIQFPEIFRPLFKPSRYKALYGGRGCVHPDTLLDTPLGQIPVRRFQGGLVWSYENGKKVVALASPPVFYAPTDLYTVKLEDGREITVTAKHRFLTPNGWRTLDDLDDQCEIAVELPSADLTGPPQSSQGTFLSKFRASVRRCWQKALDCLGCCCAGYHLCDAQLLRAIDDDQAFVPSQGGESKPTRFFWRVGVLVGTLLNKVHSGLRRLSRQGLQALSEAQSCAELGNDSAARLFELFWQSCLVAQQFLLKSSRFALILGFATGVVRFCTQSYLTRSLQKGIDRLGGILRDKIDILGLPSFSCDHSLDQFRFMRVARVDYHSHHEYCDISVKKTHNYLACGIVNHNSAKSHSAAGALVLRSTQQQGSRIVCLREVQRSLKESAKHLIEQKIKEYNLGAYFRVMANEIYTPGGGIIIFQGLRDHTVESIKSLEDIDFAVLEESHTISETSLAILRPTIRKEGSEIWALWNPRNRTDAIDQMFRGERAPTGSTIIRANYNDNPFFPDVLEQERLDCMRDDPENYDHIWLGGYRTVVKGAYFTTQLIKARSEGRIGVVPDDSTNVIKLFADLGGTGARSDHFVFWAVQFVGQAINFINHYEVQGQSIDYHLGWLREQGYLPNVAEVFLPHDGKKMDGTQHSSFEGQFKAAGYKTTVIPNQGAGAAKMRIDSVRRNFPRFFFDERRCGDGIERLATYKEKKDKATGVGLGPEHDDASHTADACGLVSIVYDQKSPALNKPKTGPLAPKMNVC